MSQPSEAIRHAKRNGLVVFLFVSAVIAGVFSGGCESSRDSAVSRSGERENGQKTPPEFTISRPEPVSHDFVGSEACAECHWEVYDEYQGHPMAHSLGPVLEESPVESYGEAAQFAPDPHTRYRVERTEEGVFHHEVGLDAEGNEIYDQGVEVHYALGSGKRGRSYLTDRGGIFFQSPISWYSRDQKWDLSPGYTPENSKRFSRRVKDVCLECHTGRLNSVAGTADRYRQPPFHELSIGCERCHGPGKAHVERHSSGREVAGPDPIVNPQKLDPFPREAVCNQCHLIGFDSILRYGRSPHDFRPGQNLGEIWTIFLPEKTVRADQTTTAVSQAQQMMTSVCYRQSGGSLGCISCHDPHSVPATVRRVDYYRSQCLECHDNHDCAVSLSERDTPEIHNSCIDCHMPRLEANDIPHTSQTDHRILKNPQAAQPVSAEPSGEEGPRIFDIEAEPLPPLEEDRARGLLLARQAEHIRDGRLAGKIEELLLPVYQSAPDDVATLDALAIAAIMQGAPDRAVRYWKEALAIKPEHEGILLSLAVHYQQEGNLIESRRYFERLLEINPWDAQIQGRYSSVLHRLGETEKAIAAAEKGLAFDPTLEMLYEWLAILHTGQGNMAEARRYRNRLARLRNR